MTLNLLDICEIKEISTKGYLSSSGDYATKEVNDLLENGWVLIKIYTTCYDQDIAPQQQTIHYVLGIDKSIKQCNEDYDAGLIPGPPQDK